MARCGRRIDGVVHPLDLDELVEMARGDIQRDLTDLECRRFLRRVC